MLIDGRGREARGTLTTIDCDAATVRIDEEGPLPSPRESPLPLTLAQALLKAEKLDLVVQKATELGVHEIVLYVSARCVAGASKRRIQRWERIAREAAKQSQRALIPPISGPLAFGDLLSLPHGGARLVFWEQISGAGHWPAPAAGSVLVVVGPEGGLTAGEIEAARAAGFHAVGLGPRLLRAETAAIAALVVCQQRWGDLAGSPPQL